MGLGTTASICAPTKKNFVWQRPIIPIVRAVHPRDWRSGERKDVRLPEMFQPGKIERSLVVVEALRPIADRLGITVSQLALAWTFHQDGVTSAIAGSRNPKHVRENAEAGDVELDDKTLTEIEDIIPLGPAFAG